MAGSLTTVGDTNTVVGGGGDIWNASDNFFYAYMKMTGDFDYYVKVESLVGNSGDGGWSKAELMARLPAEGSGDIPAGDDPHISNMANRPTADVANGAPAGVNNRGPQWRAHRSTDISPDPDLTYDGSSSWTSPNPAYPPQPPNQWLRLERVGSVFYMYTSNDGTTWNMYNPYSPQGWDTAGSWPAGADSAAQSIFTNAWPSTILLGLAVTAHNDADVSTAVFSGFKPWTPVPIAITTQPPATKSVSQNNRLEISVAATGDPVHYQWIKDGTPISRAVDATYKVDLAKLSDAGTYTCKVFGGGTTTTTTECVVTVTVDTFPPTMVSAEPAGSQTSVVIVFSEPVTAPSATTTGNYQISGGVSVTAASLSADGYTVSLTTSQQALATLYTLTVNNVQDSAIPPNPIAPGSTRTFNSVSLLSGFAYYERWDDVNGDLGDLNAFRDALAAGGVRAADVATIVQQFGGPWGATDNYNARVRTYFTAPSNGNYIFFVASDDYSYVYLSTDETPANKHLICAETGWSNQYQWTTPGSGPAEDKRSDTYASTEWPTGNVITLVAGKVYYMEALLNEGGGGDGVDVTFIKEGDADPTQDAAGMHMLGNVISWYESTDNLPPIIETNPVDNLTIDAGGTATLTASALYASSYQWTLNGKDIPGATSASYTISNAGPLNTGQYRVTASNAKGSATSGGGSPNPTVVMVKATGVFNVEAEDFDYNGGQTMAIASTMPYTGGAYSNLVSTFDVDYHNTDIQDSVAYRTLPVNQNANNSSETGGQWTMTRMGEWTMVNNFKIGWTAAGDWGNYTRTFPTPAKSYYVFAAQSYDGVSNGQLHSTLGIVTAGVGTTTQTVQNLGTFDAQGSGDWSRNNLVAMTDVAGGAVKTVSLGGTTTLRWQYDSGDADYLVFVPSGGGQPEFTGVTKNTDGSLTVSWTGGGTLQVTSDLGATPIQWTDVTGQASPYTFTPQANQPHLFARIKQ
jgi:hypothetical protein